MFSAKPQTSKTAPPKCECHKPGAPDCGDMSEKMRAEYRRLNIEDVTDSVMKVMRICGLKAWEVKAAADVIRRSFMYFEEIMLKIDRVPRKRFGKESFFHGLAHVAQMSRFDAQMAYAIVKRAFKAFYYGTGVEGRRYTCLQSKMHHGEECMWLHAAHRTAEIHGVLNGLMESERQLFEERIECVYKDLVDVLRTRIFWENDMVCTCGQPSAAPSRVQGDKAVSQAESLYSAEVELLYHQEIKGTSSAPTVPPTPHQSTAASTASSRHNHGLKKGNRTVSNKHTPADPSVASLLAPPPCKCNCPKLRCWQENGVAREAPEITAECSQGPYICRWLPFDDEEDEAPPDHYVPYPPMEDICPPCPSDDLPCDPECTCTCEVCTCQPAFDGDFEEEHLGEKVSKSGIEDHDTDFCWVGPLRGSSRERMARQREREELLKAECEQEEGEEEDFECGCTCEVKQRAFPHLFTYLTELKDKQPVQEEQKPEPEREPEETEESEDLLSKPPPYGISPETYRCWVRPKSSESESRESTEAKKQPPLVWVLAGKPTPKPEIQISIKKQHGSSTQVASAPAAAPLPKAPVLPNKPTPPQAPGKPPLAPPKQQETEDKMTKEDILDIIGMRLKQRK